MALDLEDIQERIVNKIEYLDNGCWYLKPRKGDRYPKLSVLNRTYRANRVSYRVFKGEIPPGYQVDHLCHNRCCVNPKHLEAVTREENYLRRNRYWYGGNAIK